MQRFLHHNSLQPSLAPPSRPGDYGFGCAVMWLHYYDCMHCAAHGVSACARARVYVTCCQEEQQSGNSPRKGWSLGKRLAATAQIAIITWHLCLNHRTPLLLHMRMPEGKASGRGGTKTHVTRIVKNVKNVTRAWNFQARGATFLSLWHICYRHSLVVVSWRRRSQLFRNT